MPAADNIAPVDPVSQDFYLQQKTKENDAYQKALESGKQQELDFAKGIPKGIVVGTGAAIGAGLDFLNSILAPAAKSDYQQQATDFLNKALNVTPAQKQGADLGNVTSNFINPDKAVLIPLAFMKGAANLRKVEVAGEVLHNISYVDTPVDMRIFEDLAGQGMEKATTLNKIMPNAELDKVIPGLAEKIKVKVVPPDEMTKGAAAQVNHETTASGDIKAYVVRLNEDYINKATPDQIKATLVHETQHAVQGELGMRSAGTNPGAVAKSLERIHAKLDPQNKDPIPKEDFIGMGYDLYRTNIGEQQAVAAERLAILKPLIEYKPQLNWGEMDLTELRKAFQELRKIRAQE